MKRTVFMKIIPFLIFFLIAFSINLFAVEKDTSSVSCDKIYYNFILTTGIEGYVDDWMNTTYSLSPAFGFEFSTNISPSLDGVIEFSFSQVKGSYYYPWYGYYEFERYDLTLFQRKIGLGFRVCDRRFENRTPFFEAGFDIVHAKEWGEEYSESGGAIGSHFAMGYWGKIYKNLIIQVKGRMQLLAITMRRDAYTYYSHYEIDLSGAAISIGIGFSK